MIFARRLLLLAPILLMLDSISKCFAAGPFQTQAQLLQVYPNCAVDDPRLIGDGNCDGGDYSTAECGWDGRDCRYLKHEKHVCLGDVIIVHQCNQRDKLLGKCLSDSKCGNLCTRIGDECEAFQWNWMIKKCSIYSNFRGTQISTGTVVEEVNQCYKKLYFDEGSPHTPVCKVDDPNRLGDGKCDGGTFTTSCEKKYPGLTGSGSTCYERYNTAGCGWDEGDCMVNGFPLCHVDDPTLIGNGQCNGGLYITAECGWDGGDCRWKEYKHHYCEGNTIGTWKKGGPSTSYESSWCRKLCDEKGDECEAAQWRHRSNECTLFSNFKGTRMVPGTNTYRTYYCYDKLMMKETLLPICDVSEHGRLGDGKCDGDVYNSIECNWDGGDCVVPGYPDCHVDNPDWIGSGTCSGGEYNTEECGWDGGDCLDFNGKYPDCLVDNPHWIGSGTCSGGDYNTEECGWDGGDCAVDGFPDCHVDHPEWIGSGDCFEDYNTAECGWDGGDCRTFDKFPECRVDLLGDGYCDDENNTDECGWDGGDCVVPGFPNCHVFKPSWIGNGWCDTNLVNGGYNTEECGWDGGDCVVEGYPDCHVFSPSAIGNGRCNDGEYNTQECGWDGGDCLQTLYVEDVNRNGDIWVGVNDTSCMDTGVDKFVVGDDFDKWYDVDFDWCFLKCQHLSDDCHAFDYHSGSKKRCRIFYIPTQTMKQKEFLSCWKKQDD